MKVYVLLSLLCTLSMASWAHAKEVSVICEAQIIEVQNGVSKNLGLTQGQKIQLEENNVPPEYTEIIKEPGTGITIGVRATALDSRTGQFNGLTIRVSSEISNEQYFAASEGGSSILLALKSTLISARCTVN